MNTDQLINTSKARFAHAVARNVLKEKYLAKMVFVHNEGMFRAGPELLAVLSVIQNLETAVILDLYEKPVCVDVAQLQAQAMQRWQEQMNAWLLELNASETVR